MLAALRERDRTGRGQLVRTSLLAALVGVHAFQGTAWTVAGEVGRAQGNPDYATNTSRLEHIDALTGQLERCFAGLDRDTVLAQLTKAGVPAGRIRSIDEVYEWTGAVRSGSP